MQTLLLELTRRYGEPHRHYHTIEHIADMLHRGRALALSEEQMMAIWFHDAVYEPRSDTNEEDSAKLAGERLGTLGWSAARIEVVQRIVLDTKSHRPSIPDAEPVIDLDMSPLAAEPAVYERNRKNVRLEYAHVPEADYRRGLRAFAESLLAWPRIFWTDWGTALEAPARRNLADTIARLDTQT